MIEILYKSDRVPDYPVPVLTRSGKWISRRLKPNQYHRARLYKNAYHALKHIQLICKKYGDIGVKLENFKIREVRTKCGRE